MRRVANTAILETGPLVFFVIHYSCVELGRCSLSCNLHVVKTISGALCCLHVSHSCLPCESLMYLIFLILVAV